MWTALVRLRLGTSGMCKFSSYLAVSTTITYSNLSLLCWGIIVVAYENYNRHINTFLGQNADLLSLHHQMKYVSTR